MEKWKAIAAMLVVMPLAGCTKTDRERLKWDMPQTPEAHRGGCVPLTDKQKRWCRKRGNEALKICQRAEHNRIYCDQLEGYQKRLRRNWPL